MKKLSIDVLRNRGFRFLFLSRVLGGMALQSQAVIVGWQIYSLTHNTFLLGLTGLIEAVPALCCALFAGHFVDTNHPVRVFRLCITALVLNILFLFLVSGGYVPVPQAHLIYFIFAGVFVSGLARSFLMPASFSTLSLVVPRQDLPSASAWLSSGFQAAAITGPALAGLIYGGYGAHGAWALPLCLVCFSFITVRLIGVDLLSDRQTTREPIFQSLRAGWGFIITNQVLLSVMALDMFAVLFGGAVAMLPAYADQVLHIGSQGLGILRASPALGAIVSALILALRPMKRISAMRMLWVVAGFGVCMIAFGLSTSFYLSIFFLALSGVFDSISVVIRSTLMQLLTPDAMRGRVSSVNSMFIISSNEIGSFESGTAARLMGLVPSVVFGGIMTLIVVGATVVFSPRLRKTVIEVEQSSSSA